jgi:hypothetical protein
VKAWEKAYKHVCPRIKVVFLMGSHSVFGPGLVPGTNHRAHVFEWWFYNQLTKTLEKVPDGFVPDIDQEYMDPNAPFEPSPSPEPQRNAN